MATNGYRRDTVLGGAVATSGATRLDGRWMVSVHGRVAWRDTTVRRAGTASPDSVPQQNLIRRSASL
ncbi:MAG: hypothetical protein KF751_01190 [Nitrospira sp.]|nr:hypothetical protein [Nitrospira sp.]MBX3304644.1 hypothetical protein [Nitrospira sp.]MBX3321137.1 hypothetical protein [Nitrospira sp.]